MSPNPFPSPTRPFLRDVRTYDIDVNRHVIGKVDTTFEDLVAQCLESGIAQIASSDGDEDDRYAAMIAIPIYHLEQMISIVVLASCHGDLLSGVFETWTPMGQYDELGLASGYFGKLARFQNVSSFVRFEKGYGLPGQVWNSLRAVIHDDLSNHPGFLRAAGASAGSLDTAMGIPVAGESYFGTVVLISSELTPIARGFEVWRADPDGFTLQSCSYQAEELAIPVGSTLPLDQGVPSLITPGGGAVYSQEFAVLEAGRESLLDEKAFDGVVLIPFYEGDALTSVAALLL